MSRTTDLLGTDSQLPMATSADALLDTALFSQCLQQEPRETAPLSHGLSSQHQLQHQSLLSPLEFNFDTGLIENAPVEDKETSIEVDCSEIYVLSPQSNFEPHNKTSSSHRPHYATEKRYRANLNEKIATLERLISKRPCSKPSSQAVKSRDSINADSLGSGKIKSSGKWRMPRQSKTAVLTQVINYIQEMEKETCKLRDNVHVLKQRIVKAKEFLLEEAEGEI